MVLKGAIQGFPDGSCEWQTYVDAIQDMPRTAPPGHDGVSVQLCPRPVLPPASLIR